MRGANIPEGRPTILIADDEKNILEAVTIVLQDMFDVTAVPRGDTALDVYRNGSFDLVISDVKMPGLDGIEPFREVKKIHPGQKFIFLSVSSVLHDDPVAGKILHEKADGFLGKPYRVPDLIALLERVLKQ
jgi:two-component system response regulator GlrR